MGTCSIKDRIYQPMRPAFRIPKPAITVLALLILWFAFSPSSVHYLKDHAIDFKDVLKERPVIESGLPLPDFHVPSNKYADLKLHSNISHVSYDPFQRGVDRKAWPNERQPCLGPRGEAVHKDILKYYRPDCKNKNYFHKACLTDAHRYRQELQSPTIDRLL